LKPVGVPVSAGALEEQAVELVELGVEDLLDRPEVLRAVVVGDLEHRALGPLDELARRAVLLGDALLDLVGRVEEPPDERVLADDARVLTGVAGGGHRCGEPVDRARAARLLEVAGRAQLLGDGQHVDRLALAVQAHHRRVDEPVAPAVEVVGLEALLDDQRVHRALGQEDRAEDGVLGLERVRRRERRRGRAVAALRAVAVAVEAPHRGASIGGHRGRDPASPRTLPRSPEARLDTN
jgi:hypothetical protein